MKYICYSISYLLVSLALLCSSCSSEVSDPERVEKAYLTLSEEVIHFSRESDKRVVTVRTDASSWVATSPAEGKWLELSKTGDALIISAQGNDTGQERETYVLINAAETSSVLRVHQGSQDSSIEVSDAQLSVISNGGRYTIGVSTTDEDWLLETGDSYTWLSASKNQEGNIDLVVRPNAEVTPREAKLYARTSSVAVEIVVSQLGKPAFLLPYMLEHGSSRQDMIGFEQLRGTTLVGSKEEKGEWTYLFLGNDKYSSSLAYIYPFGEGIYSSCVITTPNTKFGVDPAFEVHLASLGFAKDSKKIDKYEKGVYTRHYAMQNKLLSLTATVQVSETGNWTEIVYGATEGQGIDMPTFSSFPERNISFFNKANYHVVKAWEETDGNSIETYRAYGEQNPNVIYFAEYLPISKEPSSRLATIYFFEQERVGTMGMVSQKTDFFTNIPAAMWQTARGEYKLTEEFKNLLVSLGFEYQGENKTLGSTTYARYTDGVVLVIKVYPNYENYHNRQPVLGLAYFGLDESISAKVHHSTFMDRKAFLAPLADKAEANYQKWLKAKSKQR